MDGLGISESWAGFAEVIFDAIRNFIPVSKARSDSGKRYPTISHKCKDTITDKHGKWKRYKNCKNVSNFNKYKQARNCVVKELRISKYRYEKDLATRLKK